MGIKVNNLTKIFGHQFAVDNVSFNVQSNEIVGFLGPNGAGKSTTMKIITGFLPPSKGKVFVENYSVSDSPLQIKKIIGYLSENNPLYEDMYVNEYLRWVSNIYKLPSMVKKNRIVEMIGLCGLQNEQHKKIGRLSKGYRQRVGLAQVLLHDPKVLILDEPTSGLDPNQLAEIRGLIKDISQNKTVLFSSHILQEVEALCDRVIIIDKGKIVANDLIRELKSKINKYLIVEFASEVIEDDLKKIDGVVEVIAKGKYKFQLRSEQGVEIQHKLAQFATDKNLTLIEMKLVENSLESIFSQLTKEQK